MLNRVLLQQRRAFSSVINPKVFMDISIGGADTERITMELFADKVRGLDFAFVVFSFRVFPSFKLYFTLLIILLIR